MAKKKNPINVALLAEICEVAGTSGFEQRVREIVLREVTPLVDEVTVDNMGNVTALKKGKDSAKKSNDRSPHGRNWVYRNPH